MVKLKRFLLVSFLVINSVVAMSQSPANESGVMRSNGKIYVVVAIVTTILLALLLYVARLDSKISKLEKEKT